MKGKIIKVYFMLTAAIYCFVYLFRSFVLFEFRNPFQWVLDIPEYSNDKRLSILAFYLLYMIVANIYISVIITTNEKKAI